MQTRIYTDLTAEPVTLAEAKNFCKVTGSADDTLIALLIASARKSLEKYTASSFGEKVIHAYWKTMPENWTVDLPYGPIISVDKVYKIDAEGTETLLTVNKDYYLIGDQDITVKIEQFWSTGIASTRALRVEYTAGYGDTVTEPLPDDLKECILKEVSTNYNFRDNIQDAGSTVLSNYSRNKAAPYRKHVLI